MVRPEERRARPVKIGRGRRSCCTVPAIRTRRSFTQFHLRVVSPFTRCRTRFILRWLGQRCRNLNPVLRGWGNYFRTGNAAEKFVQVDDYVRGRLRGFLVKRKGRNLRAGEAEKWTREFFEALGLHRLRGTIRYPGVA